MVTVVSSAIRMKSVHFSHFQSNWVSCNLNLCVNLSITNISFTVHTHCSPAVLYHNLVITFLIAVSNVLIRYTSSFCTISCAKCPKYKVLDVLGSWYLTQTLPYIFPIPMRFMANVWSASLCPHCLQHDCCPETQFPLIFGVIKNLTTFFKLNSLHTLELVDVHCDLQISNHSSSEIGSFNSFPHFSFTVYTRRKNPCATTATYTKLRLT